ncbi:MAG: Hpt domain-containing protein, partial [Acinetobacter sp.]
DVADRIQVIRTEKVDYPATATINVLHNIQSLVEGTVVTTSASEPLVETFVAAIEETQPPVEEPLSNVDSIIEVETAAVESATAIEASSVVENTDVTVVEQLDTPPLAQEEAVSAVEEAASLLSIVEETFLEEAEEILATTDGLLKQWTEQRSDRSVLLQLQRAAHSLKGGARMAENEPVGAIAYELETT